MWFIGVEVEQETSAPPPEKNPGSAPEASLVKGASIPGGFLLDLTSLSLAIREFKQAI